MKLQIRVDESGIISDVKFKTFGCGSAIASSSYMTERVKGLSLEEAGKIKNTEIAKELCLPPVKLHCSSEFTAHSVHSTNLIGFSHQCWPKTLFVRLSGTTRKNVTRWQTQSSRVLSMLLRVQRQGRHMLQPIQVEHKGFPSHFCKIALHMQCTFLYQ